MHWLQTLTTYPLHSLQNIQARNCSGIPGAHLLWLPVLNSSWILPFQIVTNSLPADPGSPSIILGCGPEIEHVPPPSTLRTPTPVCTGITCNSSLVDNSRNFNSELFSVSYWRAVAGSHSCEPHSVPEGVHLQIDEAHVSPSPSEGKLVSYNMSSFTTKQSQLCFSISHLKQWAGTMNFQRKICYIMASLTWYHGPPLLPRKCAAAGAIPSHRGHLSHTQYISPTDFWPYTYHSLGDRKPQTGLVLLDQISSWTLTPIMSPLSRRCQSCKQRLKRYTTQSLWVLTLCSSYSPFNPMLVSCRQQHLLPFSP